MKMIHCTKSKTDEEKRKIRDKLRNTQTYDKVIDTK